MFSGNSTPDQADKWMRELEKIFRATSCFEDKKLIFATYLLSGEAEFWWMGAQKMMEAKAESITWESFRIKFLEKYFLDSAKFAKEAEFLRLEQGEMCVTAYAARFEYLAGFYTQATSEAWRCRKFEEGLKHNLKKVITPLCIREFPALVEKVKMIETLEKSDERVIRTHGGGSPSGKVRVQSQKPYVRPPQPRTGATPPQFRPQQSYGSPRCYLCQKEGHFIRDCPSKKNDGFYKWFTTAEE